MCHKLLNTAICMLGGDLRELELAKTLLDMQVDLRLVGYPKISSLEDAKHFSDPKAAIKDVQAVLGPMSNTDLDGKIINRLDDGQPIDLTELMPQLRKNTLVFLGVAKPVIQQLALQYQLKIIETAEVDEIAILNSIPTAEGAIQLAMEKTSITLHSSKCLILGFGRCALTLARNLSSLGANVTIAARNPAQLARATEMCLNILPMENLFRYTEFNVIFNTVPAVILTRPYLMRLSKESLIIDLAAAPGGVDFKTAEELGLEAILALSLPGKVAPITAGKILSKCIPRMLEELLGGE